MNTVSKVIRVLTLAVIGSIMSSNLYSDPLDDLKAQFVGDYELASYLSFPSEGETIDRQYIGRLSYDEFGNMSGLGMPKDLPERAAQSSERMTGGFAYWGKVSYDIENSIVTHHVEGSPMLPQWVGGENVRYFEFVDGFLKLSLKDDSGRITGTLSWRKLK